MKLKLEPVVTSYSVEVPDADFRRLLESEGYSSDRRLDDFLSTKLDNLPGVYKTDYNGHYGAQIMFSLDREDDTDANRRLILDTIKRHLESLR